MKQPAKKKGVVFYEETSWFHRVKLLQPDGSVKYSKRGGFQSEAEAEASYYDTSGGPWEVVCSEARGSWVL